jgi:hypothetical protein
MLRKYDTVDVEGTKLVAEIHGLTVVNCTQLEDTTEVLLQGTPRQHKSFQSAEGYEDISAYDQILE